MPQRAILHKNALCGAFLTRKVCVFVKNPQKILRYFYASRDKKTKKALEKRKVMLYNNKKVC
jgi:hypothetical protein